MMKRLSAFIALLVVLSTVLSLAACTGETYSYELKQRPETVEHGAIGLGTIMDISSISRLNDNVFSYGSSSYNRENTNNDGFTSGNFLYVDDEGRYVICDAKGKGVVTRIWMLGNAINGSTDHINIYVDGELIVDMPYNEFIAGQRPPFNQVFCVRDGAAGGVHVCYLAMEFEESMYIAMTEPNGFWQVDYHMVDDVDDQITSMTGEEKYTAEEMILTNLGQSLAGYTDTFKQSITAKAGKTTDVLHLDGPKQISYIELTVDGLKLPEDLENRTNQNFREVLNGLKLVINWDGNPDPAVDAPLGMLCGTGSLGYNWKTQALMYGIKDEGTLYFYFPMPFEKSADIAIENSTGADVNIDVNIGYCAVNSDFYNVGYFTTEYNNYYTFCQDPFEAVMLDVEGAGKVVSIQENVFGQVGNVWYEEGDHRFYIDGSITPQMIGCGTEDFYNGAGYFIRNNDAGAKLGLYSRMFSGYTNYLSLFDGENAILNEGISVYRTLVTDSINFRDGIKLTFEHGGGEFSRSMQRTWNTNQTAGYEVLVCYYYQPVTKMSVTDSFCVTDQSAASAHAYTSAGDESYELKSSYYGSFFMLQETKNFAATTGEISFTMKLDEDNYGAVLYRIYDQYERNLGADVYVDGEYVGQWYVAGQNTTYRFADSFFNIPEHFTAGKTSVTIRLVPNAGCTWNASEYKLYSRVDRLVEKDTPVSGKVYTISSGSKFFDHVDSEFDMGGTYASDPVTAEKKSGAVEQDFRLIEYTDGTFFIIGQGSGTLLSQSDSSVIRKMYPNSKLGDSERWELIPSGKGYLIRNVGSGQYISLSGNSLKMSDKGTVFTFTEVTARKLCIF